jgi:hypothetical protein
MGSKASAPALPDPYRTAAAQTQGDVQSAIANAYMGNANVVGPYGSTTFAQTGTHQIRDAQGNLIDVPTFTQTNTLSPEQQVLYDQQTALGSQLNTMAMDQSGRIGSLLGTPIDTSGITPIASGVDAPNYATSFSPGGPIQQAVDVMAAPTSVDVSRAPTEFGRTQGNIQYNVGPQDWSADRQRVENAIYSRLEPQLARDRGALEARLANQGLNVGDEAYARSVDEANRAATDARVQAVLAGGQEQSRLFGMDLAQGQFGNQAQAQDYAQQLGRGQFTQAGVGQNNAANLATGQFAQQGVAQNNAANLAAANYGLAAQGQQFGQNQALAGFGNDALARQYQDALNAAELNNSASAQQLQQQLALRNQPINEISSLMSGGQVQLPQFTQYRAPTLANSTIGANIYQTAGLANQQYQQQMAQQNALMQGLFGLGSSVLRGPLRR